MEYKGVNSPLSLFCINKVESFLTLRTKANDFPSGDGVGLTAPPGPLTQTSISPVFKSIASMS